MKKILKYLSFLTIILCATFIFNVGAKAEIENNNKVKVYLFYGDGCPHCKKEKEQLNNLENNMGIQLNLFIMKYGIMKKMLN